jgi:hypothetical protein
VAHSLWSASWASSLHYEYACLARLTSTGYPALFTAATAGTAGYNHRMNETSTAATLRASWWRFSLRELLLAMLAIGAFSGWGVLLYERFQRFEPTDFYLKQSDWQQESIAAARKETGETESSDLGWTSTNTWGPSAVESTTAYRVRISKAHNDAFVQALEARISDRLTTSGCQMRGFAGSDSGHNQALIVGYRAEGVAGVVDVCFFPSDGSHARLVITVHEQRAPSGDAKVGAAAARLPPSE